MIVLYTFFTIFSAIYLYYKFINNNIWKKRNVAHPRPLPFFGNYKNYILLRKYGPQITQEICQKFPDEPYIGVYYGTDPALIIQDPNIIKLVMQKDFYYFNQREISKHTHKELITQNMFFSGGDSWKVIRQNMTTLFTSAKMKNMFHLIENCAKSLENVLACEVKTQNNIEVKSLLARYTMDCIGSCAFGINTGTLERNSESNPFFVVGYKIFDSTIFGGFRTVARAMWPSYFYSLGFQLFPNEIITFFKTVITEVFKTRQSEISTRNDFVDLFLGWKKTKKRLVGDSITNMNTNIKSTVELEIDDTLLISQCVLLYAAGYETTSTTISLLLFELAKDEKVQARVIEEVDNYFQRHSGKIEFECINEMPFLQACIEETLRLYPVLGTLTREVEEEYTLPTGLRLDKGLRVHIPVYHLHHDPQHFPEPEKFRPERFYADEKKNIKPFTYMPFGEGPRICIGINLLLLYIVMKL